ncbi:MAG TPA: HEAT repeat domain-containing protein [Rectinemataceae bacterium]|nr:HEAT repeat domain-containing protein [Rectinemataceae bacterium]
MALAAMATFFAAMPAMGADLPPLFKLSIGGRPLAPPVLDTTRARAALWTLSEDGSLYLLSEDGRLLFKKAIAGPEPWLGLDPFGRALVISDDGQGPRLEVLTRLGNLAWTFPLERWVRQEAASGEAKPSAGGGAAGKGLDGVDFGPDGRFLLRSGRHLLCLSPAGRPLWSYELPLGSSCAPALDAEGDFLFGLTDGSVLVLSPYGERLDTIRALSAGLGAAAGAGVGVTALAAFGQTLALGYGDGRVALSRDKAPLALIGRTGAAQSFIAIGTIEAGEATGGGFATGSERIVALDRLGTLSAFDLDGRRLWGAETGLTSASLFPAVSRLVVTGEGKAVSYSWEGELLREASITNAVARAVLAPSGLLFSAGADWILAAYRYEAPLQRLASPSPPACPADPSALVARGISEAGFLSEGRQLSLVADIEKRLDSATIGEREAGDRAVLEAMAKGSLSEAEWSSARRRFQLFVRPRVEACRLLGEIGSPASIDALVDIALSKADPSVRAAALRAIGAIGVDPGVVADRAFAIATSATAVDEEVASALVDAIEAIALRSGATPSPEAARALMALSGPLYPAAVGARAEAALARLARWSVGD